MTSSAKARRWGLPAPPACLTPVPVLVPAAAAAAAAAAAVAAAEVAALTVAAAHRAARP